MSSDLRNRVGELVGEASMCWDPIPTGVFDSTRSLRIVDDIMRAIDDPRRFANAVGKMSGFELVRLETVSGGYVETVRVPRFDPRAHVIVWGLRSFAYYDTFSPNEGPEAIAVYRECLAYVVPMQSGLRG